MRVTVCQLRNSGDALQDDWARLVRHVQEQRSDLVLLPEMPFAPWPFWRHEFDPVIWNKAVAAHEAYLKQLPKLQPATVLFTRPVNVGTYRYNEGLLWDSERDAVEVHTKAYLPDETGFWEASWYERGSARFKTVQVANALVGMLICTEMWFTQHARALGKAGAHIVAVPRATEQGTVDKWTAGGRTVAVVSGAYCLSSNLVNDRPESDTGGSSLGGQGWIIDPEGKVLALTNVGAPFVTQEIDLAVAEAAKQTYPRYVKDD